MTQTIVNRVSKGNMPKVGKKHFSYTVAGKKAAKSYAKKTGKKVSYKKK
mgnify:CR=1 FL=1|jgi:hypothetical protein